MVIKHRTEESIEKDDGNDVDELEHDLDFHNLEDELAN